MKIHKWFVVMLLCLCFSFPVYCAEEDEIYCSIKITPVALDGGNVVDGEYTLYRVANIGTNELILTDEFKNSEMDPDTLYETASIDELKSYISNKNLVGIVVQINEDGEVTIGGEKDDIITKNSVYLVVNTKASTGYELALSALISTENNENYISDNTYEVEMEPKLEKIKDTSNSSTSSNSSSNSSSGSGSKDSSNSSSDSSGTGQSGEDSAGSQSSRPTGDMNSVKLIGYSILLAVSFIIIKNKRSKSSG